MDEASLGLHHLISTAHLASSRFEVSERLLDEAGDWLITLGKRNAASGVFDMDAFAARLSLHWRMLCGACAGLGGKTWRRYANSPLRPAVRPAKAELLLRLACLFHIGQERRNQAYGALRAALALKGRVLVITSYSIHYTKLYELDTRIQNLWANKAGEIHRNALRPFADIDAFEFDREGIAYNGVFTGRGCAGNCNFCASPFIKSKLGIKGKYFRKRSLDSVISEIERMIGLNYRHFLYGIKEGTTLLV